MKRLFQLINVGFAGKKGHPEDELHKDGADRPHVYRARVESRTPQQLGRTVPPSLSELTGGRSPTS
jgi:hypothetical protein